MDKGEGKKQFDDLVSGRSDSLAEIKWREKNELWLDESARIAILVLSELKRRGWDKQELAFRMDVSPEYIGKLVKGRERYTHNVIAKIERVLGLEISKKRKKGF